MTSQSSTYTVTLPTLVDLQETNQKYNLQLPDEELTQYQAVFQESIKSYNFVNEFDLPKYVSKYEVDRSFEYVSADKNPYNAWHVKCNIKGTKVGKLAGKKIAVKDNVPIAGVPMMNGSAILEDYVPDHDATIIQRIIAEGGTIIGKTTCEDMCYSGASFNTKKGPVKNPLNSDYTSGGSSSGSAVVVATGEADMAIGGDQGGSIRIPSSNCGIVGIKPTHGLVPYTGAVPIAPCIDHLGPMAKTVEDCALLLEVIAGFDGGRDYRQRQSITIPEYSKMIYPHQPVKENIKIGVLQDGIKVCHQNVQDVFQKAVEILEKDQNLVLTNVDLPYHEIASKAAAVLIFMGAYDSMVEGCGYGMGVSGFQSPELLDKLRTGYKEHGPELSDTLKVELLLCDYIKRKYGPYHYAKASTILASARQEYDVLLQNYDVIIMPTLAKTPCKLPDVRTPLAERIDRSFNILGNTSIYNATGHPALSLNCGFVNGLPVGLMIVGKHFDESKVLNVASIFEKDLKQAS